MQSLPLGASLMGALAVVGASAPARAEQFVIADEDYTHSAMTTSDSHLRVSPKPSTPSNWQSPIDYANGSAHVRLEVKSKPSAAPTKFQVCFEMAQNYACTAQSPTYTTTGIVEWDSDVASFWKPGAVDWSKGVVKVALILKDDMNGKPAPENVGMAKSAEYMPTDLHAVVTLVSAGATFVAPQDPPSDAGTKLDAGSKVGADAGSIARPLPPAADGGARPDSGSTTSGPASRDAGATAQEPAPSKVDAGATAGVRGDAGRTDQSADGGTSGKSDREQDQDAGCSLGARSSSSAAALWLLATVGLAWRRRRRITS